MYKVELNSGVILEATDYQMPFGNLKFTVPGITDYKSYRAYFTPENCQCITIRNGDTAVVWEGRTVFKEATLCETADGTLTVTVTLAKPSEAALLAAELEQVKKQLAQTQATILKEV